MRHLLADDANRIVLVTYTDDTAAAQAATATLTAAADAHDLPASAWIVTSTGYRSLDCTDPDCCPPQGRPLADLTSTQVAATLTVQGSVVAPDRAALGVTPAPEPQRTAADRAARAWMDGWTTQPTAARASGLATWRAVLSTDDVRPGGLGVIGAALADVILRDAILCSVLPDTDTDLPDRIITGDDTTGAQTRALAALIQSGDGLPPGDDAERAAVLLTKVAAHSAASRTPAPLTLLAVLAWWSGDGAKAGVLVDQALAADPTYRLALLIGEVLAAGMPPGWVRRTR